MKASYSEAFFFHRQDAIRAKSISECRRELADELTWLIPEVTPGLLENK